MAQLSSIQSLVLNGFASINVEETLLMCLLLYAYWTQVRTRNGTMMVIVNVTKEMTENGVRADAVESLTLRDKPCYNHACMVEEQTDYSKNSCSNMYPAARDRRSNIRFKLANGKYLQGDMFLYSSYGSHFVESKEENRYLSQMQLRDGDKVLGINYQPSECYDHESVVEMLHYLLYPPVKFPINLMVERYHEDGPKVVEIQISGTDDEWASFEVDKEDPILPITVQVFFSVKFTLNIHQIRVMDQSKVLIAPASVNEFVFNVDIELFIGPGKDKDNNVFDYYEYDGRARRRGRLPDKMFFAVFRSFASKLYITARSETELLLTSGDEPPRYNDRKIKQDDRSFIVHKTDKGYSMFESLTFRGCYWVSHDNSKRLVMRKLSRRELNEDPDAWFTLVSFQNVQ